MKLSKLGKLMLELKKRPHDQPVTREEVDHLLAALTEFDKQTRIAALEKRIRTIKAR